jgi:hypothetical protein
VSRSLLAKLLLGLVGLVLIGGLAVRAADPDNQPPAGHQHGENGKAAPDGDVSWPLLAAPTGVAVTFALATGVFLIVTRRRRNRTVGRHTAASRRARVYPPETNPAPASTELDAPGTYTASLAKTPGAASLAKPPGAASLARTPGAAEPESGGE